MAGLKKWQKRPKQRYSHIILNKTPAVGLCGRKNLDPKDLLRRGLLPACPSCMSLAIEHYNATRERGMTYEDALNDIRDIIFKARPHTNHA